MMYKIFFKRLFCNHLYKEIKRIKIRDEEYKWYEVYTVYAKYYTCLKCRKKIIKEHWRKKY